MLRRIMHLLRRRYLIFLFACSVVGFYIFFLSKEGDFNTVQYVHFRYRNTSAEVVDGYLVWNFKCHIISKDPWDPSINEFIKNEKFENCSKLPALTTIERLNDDPYLKIKKDILKNFYNQLNCCWSPVTRPKRIDDHDMEFDSKISIGECHDFEDSVIIPKDVEAVKVSCRSATSYLFQVSGSTAYKNVHAVIQTEKMKERLRQYNVKTNDERKLKNRNQLSVLILGIDTVSRLNFYRTMPHTKNYLDDRGWFELRGYNKMGENTFPNLMAFLTGQSEEEVFAKCKPDVAYGLDNCPIIWNDFKKAGYITAYGEDNGFINTFNYLKVGFVNPPTDYYLRPYVLASEDLRKGAYRLFERYCAGPELAFDRIFDYAMDFAKVFLGKPYFGLFWSSSVTHENVNGASMIDDHFLAKLLKMESAGVMNDTMIVFLSDHGVRYGSIRNSFLGWYEDRLPFVQIWLPEWFRKKNPEVVKALRVNQHRLTSPFDFYETLRDIVDRAGGKSPSSSGCPKCSSLLKPVARERGCRDAGISGHWCTCNAFQLASTTDEIVVEGANRFIDYIESIVKEYKNEEGVRLCAKPKLKKIKKVNQLVDLDTIPGGNVLELSYSLEVEPGNGVFEVTVRYYGSGNYSIKEAEISRTTSYLESAKCLDTGLKKYCQCVQ